MTFDNRKNTKRGEEEEEKGGEGYDNLGTLYIIHTTELVR